MVVRDARPACESHRYKKNARLFDSAVVPLFCQQNLHRAPGGPRWGCDVGCTCNRGGIGLLWPGLSHPAYPDGVSLVTFCRRRSSTWPCLVCAATS